MTDNINFDQDSTWSQVANVTDYYPFGLAMDGRTVQDSSYRYGFNGKEQDSPGMGGGGNTYDYGFRIYNPKIAKFLSVDPIASNFPYFSPYQFAGLDPIKYIDLDGLERAYIDPGSGRIIPASDFHQHTPPPGAQFLNSGPGKKELDQNMEGLRTIGGFIPGLDWAIDGQDAYNEFSEGNYLLGTLSGLSLIPGADFITKPLKLAIKRADEIVDIVKVSGKKVESIQEFYREANRLNKGERTALYREVGGEFAKKNNWKENKELMKKNKDRTIYSDEGGLNYSLDTQHGRFEVLDKKGKHKGEIDFGSKVTKGRDKSGKHDIKVK